MTIPPAVKKQVGRFLRLFLPALGTGLVAQATSGTGLTVSVIVGIVVGALEVAYRQMFPA